MGASAAGVREGVRSEAHRRHARPPARRCRNRARHVGPLKNSSEIEIARSRAVRAGHLLAINLDAGDSHHVTGVAARPCNTPASAARRPKVRRAHPSGSEFDQGLRFSPLDAQLEQLRGAPAPRGQFRGSSEGPAIAQERQDRPSKPTTGYFASIISSVPDSDIAGDVPPLNYQARDRKIVIVESEAKIAASSAAMPNSARYDC